MNSTLLRNNYYTVQSSVLVNARSYIVAVHFSPVFLSPVTNGLTTQGTCILISNFWIHSQKNLHQGWKRRERYGDGVPTLMYAMLWSHCTPNALPHLLIWTVYSLLLLWVTPVLSGRRTWISLPSSPGRRRNECLMLTKPWTCTLQRRRRGRLAHNYSKTSPNRGHFGNWPFVPCREVVLFS